MKPNLHNLLKEHKLKENILNTRLIDEIYPLDITDISVLICVCIYENDEDEEYCYKANLAIDYTKGYAGDYNNPPEPMELEVPILDIETVDRDNLNEVMDLIYEIDKDFFTTLYIQAEELITYQDDYEYD